jgi:hypothetical protein
MRKLKRQTLHKCVCPICQRHPYSGVAKTHRTINRIMLTFNEKHRRQFVGVLARQWGRGGVQRVADITGLSRHTICRGQAEASQRESRLEQARVRRAGGGRKEVEEKQPGVAAALTELLKDVTAGDPMTGVKWTKRTLRKLSRQLKRQHFSVSHETVRRLLRQRHYAQRVNRKRLATRQAAERDQQIRYITRCRNAFLQAKKPVISVDAKKRELVGNFKHAGRTWRQVAHDVLAEDYPSLAKGVAIPYGIYEIAPNHGFVVVGTSHQTPEFSVAAIRLWCQVRGRELFAQHHELLIEADGGGGNGHRCWLWKWGLQQVADEFNLTITVTHLPTGASKWNPVEHRLFAFISGNWEGEPLISYETVLKFIRTTKTETGLRCQARLDKHSYPVGHKITPEQKAQINIVPHHVLPKWNYTIKPHQGE